MSETPEEIRFAGKTEQLYRCTWKNNEKRRTLHNRICRVIARISGNSRVIEFQDNGQREVISGNALRRIRI
jgi:hypothetical protein